MAAKRPEERAYRKAPIIEAVIQLAFAEPLSASMHRKQVKRIAREYENQLAENKVEAKLDFVTQKANFTLEPQSKLSSGDETDIAVVSPRMITWSRLAPYQGWDTFIARVRRDAEILHSVTGHRKLARIGVRYINRLDVPSEESIVRYEDFLAINIALPKEWSVVENYAWRFEKALPDRKLLMIVQSAITPPELPDHGAFLLDIDVVAQIDLPAKLSDTFEKLEDMRALKNEVFEVSITDKARASFSS